MSRAVAFEQKERNRSKLQTKWSVVGGLVQSSQWLWCWRRFLDGTASSGSPLWTGWDTRGQATVGEAPVEVFIIWPYLCSVIRGETHWKENKAEAAENWRFNRKRRVKNKEGNALILRGGKNSEQQAGMSWDSMERINRRDPDLEYPQRLLREWLGTLWTRKSK